MKADSKTLLDRLLRVGPLEFICPRCRRRSGPHSRPGPDYSDMFLDCTLCAWRLHYLVVARRPRRAVRRVIK